ncbi:MAG: ribose 5-phosphate isomerase B [Acidobacteria bacterium]|nr:ribose 5-phosphate isomerase B [Acidobacteriota bacterium]
MVADRKITLVVEDPLQERKAERVALGSDHAGFQVKERLKPFLLGLGYDFLDHGTYSEQPVDYPDVALAVAEAVASGEFAWGILLDGAGIGSAIAANKVPGVRAALCYDQASARNSREHNHANVLALGARLLDEDLIRKIVETWLQTPFGGERHLRRVNKISEIERRYGR